MDLVELSREDVDMTKGIAIILMLCAHLFCTKNIDGVFNVRLYINNIPSTYYIGLLGASCVNIYIFCSGYGLYNTFISKPQNYIKRNLARIMKLLLNFWIILVLFVVIGFIAGKRNVYPGSISTFILNFILISKSYNGAWWFLQTYIIIVVLSPMLNKVIEKYSAAISFLFFAVIYLGSYLILFKNIIASNNAIVEYLILKTALVGLSLFPYVVGGIFVKHKIYEKLHTIFCEFRYRNLICILGIVSLIAVHGIIESDFISPFIGIAFLCFFNLMNKSSIEKKIYKYLYKHSTNIWLTHMFFYMTIFSSIVFYSKEPTLIFFTLLILCLMASYVINYIYKGLIGRYHRHISMGDKKIGKSIEV